MTQLLFAICCRVLCPWVPVRPAAGGGAPGRLSGGADVAATPHHGAPAAPAAGALGSGGHRTVARQAAVQQMQPVACIVLFPLPKRTACCLRWRPPGAGSGCRHRPALPAQPHSSDHPSRREREWCLQRMAALLPGPGGARKRWLTPAGGTWHSNPRLACERAYSPTGL